MWQEEMSKKKVTFIQKSIVHIFLNNSNNLYSFALSNQKS